MSTKSKAKGTAAERDVVRYLQQWWPAAERRALSGAKDRGDVAGIPGVVVEVKAAATQLIGPWQRETEVERLNAGAMYGMLVVKRPRKSVPQWDAYLPVATAGELLEFKEGSEWLRMDLRLATAFLWTLRSRSDQS